MSLVTVLHHITVCAGGAQEDVDFLTQVFGQRLIKQTILFDGRYAHYHLYYANANAEPGSVYTTFPYNRVKGRPGAGQIQATAYTIPKGATKFWKEHLDRSGIVNGGIQERFGQKFIRFNHPSGLQLEVIEAKDNRTPWSVGEVTKDVATGGFHSPVLSLREVAETERFFADCFGFRKTGQEGNYIRLEIGDGGAARTIELVHEPQRPSGSWTYGAGTAHHVALNIPNDEGLTAQKAIYEELGYTDCSEIKDRNYFHSIYCRCPGGVLVECAATAEGGFARDEPADQLGEELLLPPWFEEKRAEIVAMLEPITIPESNFPVKVEHVNVSSAVPGSQAATAGSAGGPSRRKAEFVKADQK